MAIVICVGAVTPLRRAAGFGVVALCAVGCLLAFIVVLRWQALTLPADTTHGRVLVEASIIEVPLRSGPDVRFDAEVRLLEGLFPGGVRPQDARPRRARLAWREPGTAPRVGERWRLVVRIAPFAEQRNFTGADLERIAFRDGIHFVGRVLPAALNARSALANVSIDTLRARIAARIADDVADPDAAALLTALAVGLDDGLSLDQWRVFNATGTTHLIAISGLHVTLFALAAFFCARRLWRHVPPARRVARETFALSAGCAAAGGYALLAGFSVPAQRTWLMLGVFALARLQARHTGAGRVWALALIAVLLLDPCAPLAAGFWLSFAAAGVILWTETTTVVARVDRMPAGSALRVQLVVMLALAPLTIAVFGSVSLAGFAANLVAIPLISFVLVPLVLAGAMAALFMPQGSTPLFEAAAALYHWSWPGLVALADAPFAVIRTLPSAGWCAVALIAGALAVQRWPWPIRAAGLALALPLLFPASRMPGPAHARVTVLDAGRGSVALIVTHTHTLLFDTGDTWNTGGSRLRQVVIPALDALGSSRVDLLVLPSLDPDRAAGAALLAHERGVTRIVAGGGWPGATWPVARCVDEAFRWDGVDFRLLAAGTRHDRCVVRVTAGGHSLLLGGDLGAADERGLAARIAVASDAVLISHHASALASSREWIGATAARLAIASGGGASAARATILERWRQSGAAILDTRRDGAIELSLGTAGIEVRRLARSDGYPFAWRRLP